MAAPRRDNIRQQILEVTMRLLEHDSYEGVSLSRIAAEAGISKGTLYYHFKSRDTLLLALAEYYLQQQREELSRWADDPSEDPTLHGLVSYLVRQDVRKAPMRMQLYSEATQGNADIRARLCEFYNSYHDLVTQKLSERVEGISAGFLSWLVLLASDGLYLQDAIENENVDLDSCLSSTAEVLRRYMKK